MNPIDRLCELLDERGVKYERVASGCLKWVRWKGVGGLEFSAIRSNREPDMLYFNDTCVSPEVAVKVTLGETVTGDTSDGYHTFNELYHHRAILFSVIVHDHRDIAWKSRKHHDGTMYDGMFIVGISTPWGQATYHYDYDPYWPMFDCREILTAPEWDGHTPSEAIERIARLASKADGTCHIEGGCVADKLEHDCPEFILYCDQCGHGFGYIHYGENGNVWTSEVPRYCPNCGRKVFQP